MTEVTTADDLCTTLQVLPCGPHSILSLFLLPARLPIVAVKIEGSEVLMKHPDILREMMANNLVILTVLEARRPGVAATTADLEPELVVVREITRYLAGQPLQGDCFWDQDDDFEEQYSKTTVLTWLINVIYP